MLGEGYVLCISLQRICLAEDGEGKNACTRERVYTRDRPAASALTLYPSHTVEAVLLRGGM